VYARGVLRRAAWLASIVACATTPTSAPVVAPVEVTRPSEPVVVAEEVKAAGLRERLAGRAVHHDDFARTVLYTWTTAGQIEALRASRRLLVAEAKAGVGPSAYVLGLTRVVKTNGVGRELAALLLEHAGLRRRRYAWTSPFATTMGLGPVRYGDALVRVELDEAAVIVGFRPGTDSPFTAVDVRGEAVALAELVADPGRIAAVYHVRDGPREAVGFREYVLCNEARIAAWSIATPEIRAQVDADVALLDELRGSALAWLPAAAIDESPTTAWPTARANGLLLDAWQASLAFANQRYRPTADNFAAIAAAMRGYDGGGAPLVHRPEAVSPGPMSASRTSAGHTAQAGQASR